MKRKYYKYKVKADYNYMAWMAKVTKTDPIFGWSRGLIAYESRKIKDLKKLKNERLIYSRLAKKGYVD